MPPPDVFVCQGCGRESLRDMRRGRRLQSYCGRRACQRKRKAKWQREKLASDPKYRAEQKAAQKIWRDKEPGYWSRYRGRKARAAEQNRSKQRRRDRRRRGRGGGGVEAQPTRTSGEVAGGRYVLEPVGMNAGGHWEVVLLPAEPNGGVLAKMDALNGDKTLAQSGV